MALEKIDDRAVLAYLKAKRVALDRAIAALEGKASDSPAVFNGGDGLGEIQSDSFVGMNIATAGVKYLKMVGGPARTTEEVYSALSRGGLPHFSRESVATILQRVHNQGGDIVKVSKGVWGLAAWYPNRPKPRKKKSQEEGEDKESITEKEKRKQPKSRQSKKTNRSPRVTLAKAGQINTIAVKWFRMLREAGQSGIPTAKLAAELGYDSGRSLSFIASNINKKLVAVKIDPKTVYEARRVGKVRCWFAKEKIGEGLNALGA